MHKDVLPDLKSKIHTIREKQVMLDRDLAEMYGVETRVLNQTVKRNIERFPEEFCFQLSSDEYNILYSFNKQNLKSQNVTSSWGGIRKLPYAFTEQGVSMLSAVLKSKKAIQISIQIIKAFVAMRHFLLKNANIFARLDSVERKQIEYQIKSDDNFTKLFTALESKQLTPNQGIFYDGQIYDGP
ncbi:MAG: ORF6N domain-containing protein [Candidatus Woesearchaeota archaeon]